MQSVLRSSKGQKGGAGPHSTSRSEQYIEKLEEQYRRLLGQALKNKNPTEPDEPSPEGSGSGGDRVNSHTEAWATAELALGMSQMGRFPEDPTADLERALVALNNARSVFTRERRPDKWAEITMELGSIYLARKEGVKSHNRKSAIECFTDCLTVYQRDTQPREWAMCQAQLGKACLDLGDAADCFLGERSLLHYKMALALLTKENWPELWHKIHLELSLLHRKYPTWPDALALADEHFRLAFDIDRDKDPELYDTLARTYSLYARLFDLQRERKPLEENWAAEEWTGERGIGRAISS